MKTTLNLPNETNQIDWSNPPKAVMLNDGKLIVMGVKTENGGYFSGTVIFSDVNDHGIGHYSKIWWHEKFKPIPEGTVLTIEF